MKNSSRLISAFLVAGLLVGCGSDPGYNEETVLLNRQAGVQFVNMVTGSPVLTIGHGLTSSRVPYGQASEVTLRPVDRYDWRVVYLAAGGDQVTLLQGENVRLVFDSRQTYFIMGAMDDARVEIVNQPEPTSERVPADTGEAWFAANPDTPAMMDVYITDFGASLDGLSPQVTITNGTISDVSSLDKLTDRQLRITRGADPTALLFDSGRLTLTSQVRQLYAIIANSGPDGADHVDVIAASSGGQRLDNHAQPARVRVANLTALDTVNVLVGEVNAGTLGRTEQSSYLESAGGSRDVTVRDPAGNLVQVIESSVARGKFNSIYLFGATEGGEVTAIQVEDENRSIKERVNFQFVSGDAETLDLYLLRNGDGITDTRPSLNDVSRGTSGIIETEPGLVTLTVTNADASKTLATIDTSFSTGNAYTLAYATGGTLALYTQ